MEELLDEGSTPSISTKKMKSQLKAVVLFFWIYIRGVEKEDKKKVPWTFFPTRLANSLHHHQKMNWF